MELNIRIAVDWMQPDALTPERIAEVNVCAESLAACHDERILCHLRSYSAPRSAGKSLEALREARTRAQAEHRGPRVVWGLGAGSAAAKASTSNGVGYPSHGSAVGGYGLRPPQGAVVALFEGPLDRQTCPLCQALVGSRFRVGSEEYRRYMPPLHINCRHFYVYFLKGAPGARIEFRHPPEQLVREYGHFISDPEDYAALRVPSAPTGRVFRVRLIDAGE